MSKDFILITIKDGVSQEYSHFRTTFRRSLPEPYSTDVIVLIDTNNKINNRNKTPYRLMRLSLISGQTPVKRPGVRMSLLGSCTRGILVWVGNKGPDYLLDYPEEGRFSPHRTEKTTGVAYGQIFSKRGNGLSLRLIPPF